MNRQRIFHWLKVIVLIYCIIGIALYYLQEKFLFHPEKLSGQYVYHFKVPFEEVNIPFNKTDTVNMVKFFPADSTRKGVVLYFHGNRQNIERYAKFTNLFTKHGYEVWMPDYPGFGKSTGSRKEENLYTQAMQVRKMAGAKYGADSIIIFGKSFGTGIAAYVATESNNQRLILETPYYSIPSLFATYAPIYPTGRMSTYKIPTYSYLEDVKYPISIFHGDDDAVIPYRNASRLKKHIKSGDEFITIEKGTHHNLAEFKTFTGKIDSLLSLR